MKIFNWIFSSFFRTLGRFLFYIAIGFIAMLFISGKVHAATGSIYIGNDTRQIITPTVANFYSCTSTGCFEGNTGAFDTDGGWFATPDTVTHDGWGESICFDYPNAFNTNNIYSMTVYIGKNVADEYGFQTNVKKNYISLGSTLGSAINNYNNNAFYTTLHYSNYRGTMFEVYSHGANNSYVTWYSSYLTYIFTANGTGTAVCVPFNSVGTTFFGYTMFFGYEIEVLGTADGLTSSDIQNIISNSGLATATSVSQVQSSINQVKQEVQSMQETQEETNEKLDEQIQQDKEQHEETMNTITSTDSANLDALQNSAGWLPAGPVDSILNLPLSLLNNLTTNLNKRCQPVILPIPYVNEDLTLPCVNTLYDDMGVSVWVTTIGAIASAFIMLSYLLKLYKWVDDTLSFRENNQIDNWGGI